MHVAGGGLRGVFAQPRACSIHLVQLRLGLSHCGEVSELADERDLGSRGAIRESSNLSFPTLVVVRAEVAQW